MNIMLLLVPYLLGSIPSGLILMKLFAKEDIRKKGSGNIGATNALRTGGKILGLLTLISDCCKGLLAIYIAKSIGSDQYIWAALSVVGHIFPIWLNFRGGKGVATTIAVLTYLNWHEGLVAGAVWLLVFFITRTASIASLTGLIIAAFTSYFWNLDIKLFYLSSFLVILVIFKHKDNIKRLRDGKEQKFTTTQD